MTELDPFYGSELEEQVLSSMMGGRNVQSLAPYHFTTPLRRSLYIYLSNGSPYEDLDSLIEAEGFPADERAYITDIYLCPSLHGDGLRSAVSELKRIHLMRRFCEAVDEWRKAAPMLDWPVAIKRLGEIIRRQGEAAARDEFAQASSPSRGQRPPSPASPK